MRVLKTKFTSWEESDEAGRGADQDDVVDEANAPTAPMPHDVATSSRPKDQDMGSRNYAADVSSPGAGGSSSRSSRDSLFRPKRSAGTVHG